MTLDPEQDPPQNPPPPGCAPPPDLVRAEVDVGDECEPDRRRFDEDAKQLLDRDTRVEGLTYLGDSETGGQVAIFMYADGTKLEIEIPHVIGMAGGGDSVITMAWWRLRQGDVVIKAGPLLDVLMRRPE